MSYDKVSKELKEEYWNFLNHEGFTRKEWPFKTFLENIIEHSDDRKRKNVARTMLDVRRKDELKARLEEEYGFEDHPKKDKLFEMAWDRRHDEGKRAVEEEYAELSELLD